MKTMITVDGSEYTRRAVDFYLDHKRSFGKFGSVTLLHVRPAATGLLSAALRPEVLAEHEQSELQESMGWARKRFGQYEVPFLEIIEQGGAAEKIVEIAERGDFELIIMGSRGHGALPGLSLGSTTLKVLASTKVAVLVVR